jgi:hypothetical protein
MHSLLLLLHDEKYIVNKLKSYSLFLKGHWHEKSVSVKHMGGWLIYSIWTAKVQYLKIF